MPIRLARPVVKQAPGSPNRVAAFGVDPSLAPRMIRLRRGRLVPVDPDGVSLRPVEEGDLGLLARFSLEPDALGEFQWAGFTDPRSWRRQWEENGLLGEDSSTLTVVAPDGSFAGMVGWRPVISMSGRGAVRRWQSCLEIGIALLPEFRGRGYGMAAQARLVEYLFHNTPVHRIQAVTTAGNAAEERALEKAGFRREGVMREVGLWRGQWVDAVIYSVLRHDSLRR